MAEYIERDALREKILGQFPDAHYPSWYAELLNEVPAADVVEVVRCKDCKHYKSYTGWCKIHSHFLGGILGEYNRFGKEDYCSHGERKGDT